MPVILDQTKSEVKQPEIREDYNSVKIKSHSVDNTNQRISIVYDKFMDGVNVGVAVSEVSGAEFMAIALGVPSPGATRYEDNKATLYDALLVKLGLTGTVE